MDCLAGCITDELAPGQKLKLFGMEVENTVLRLLICGFVGLTGFLYCC
jgi:hypothetical protein